MDGIDIGHLEQTVQTAGYRFIETRMKNLMESKLRELRGEGDHAATERIRGFLDGVERCMQIPAALRKEWEQQKGPK